MIHLGKRNAAGIVRVHLSKENLVALLVHRNPRLNQLNTTKNVKKKKKKKKRKKKRGRRKKTHVSGEPRRSHLYERAKVQFAILVSVGLFEILVQRHKVVLRPVGGAGQRLDVLLAQRLLVSLNKKKKKKKKKKSEKTFRKDYRLPK